MMTQKAKLERLLAKVEAGEARFMSEYFRVSDILGSENATNAWSSNGGSLDAVHSLHKAVLGDRWAFRSSDPNNTEWVVTLERRVSKVRLDVGQNCVQARQSPSRAWLIAIIKALISECEE
ncbi:MAG: hypothetical protein COA96_10260 [SAR86 cluster bacterium]|uniref:Uncharacterized protein n=1 Tax=SAR86 cluster bacterium TaxID=2030880 RepID=A0A2A5AXY0_9GAMM|nr:MAG: hypothetical protein COA96_10260 [SAR86 cluster bacterium]